MVTEVIPNTSCMVSAVITSLRGAVQSPRS
jgi:hypothetical protein